MPPWSSAGFQKWPVYGTTRVKGRRAVNIILSFGAASKPKFCKLCVKMPNAKVGLVKEWVHERSDRNSLQNRAIECSFAKFPPAASFAKFPPAAHRGRGIRNDSQSEGSPFLSYLGENFGVYFLT
jgi:hypothetical protein